ncbi:MAG: c-type cytochrome biogenesis protein CcmI [Burkholderiaceae bacterium]
MSLFLVYAVGLIALALVMVLPALLRRRPSAAGNAGAPVDAARANVQVLREQLAALDAERAAGGLDDAQYQLARSEIERRALEEDQAGEAAPVVARRSVKTAVVLALFIPVFAVLVYAALGQPQAIDPVVAGDAKGDVTLPQIEAMVDGLAKRLESQTTPQEGDLQAWTMLANSYAVMQRYPQASKAYARARALSPDNAQLLVDHADVLAMMQGQSIEGEPGRLVMRALQLQPNNLKALTMAGGWAFERRDYAGAVDYWSRAQPLAPPGSEFATNLASSLQQARAAAAQDGTLTAAAGATQQPQPKPGTAAGKDAKPGTAVVAHVSGEVQVTDVLAKRVRPTDTVFVFARAAEGPRMPLAILKRQAADLPFTFTLDDSSAMGPQFRISGVKQVIVGARVSASGDATPRSGDLTGQIGPVDVGSGKLVLMIDSVVP